MPESGSKIGSYEIVRELGRGGMGVVYLARDAKLDRDVAIKVLPAELAEDKERVLRFEREAKTLASLNHPNIGAIYGFEEAGDKRFLVLEYVEGETLSQRIKNGPLQIDDALEVGKQIADALEAAHEKGVIHRDLKPANVQIRPDGTVKVLDFGLAKAMAPTDESSQAQIENSPTITADFTLPGTILGTAAYMSPEQARGKHLDKRSDIWSFGCVLFECLGGRKPFEGETATDLIARILEREPNWENLPPETPPFVKTVLRRCLQKARKDRLRDAGDVGLMLAGPAQEDGREDLSGGAARTGNRRLAIVGFISAILAASLTGLGVWSAMQPKPPRVTHLALPQPQDRTVFHRQSAATFAISRDGRSVAYCSMMRSGGLSEYVLVLWEREKVGTTTFTDLGRPVEEPFFSPDGRWIGYLTEDELRAVSVKGRTTRRICELKGLPGKLRGAHWRDDGLVVFGTDGGGLYSVPAAGGTPRPLTSLAEDERAHAWPDSIPGTDSVLYSIVRNDVVHLAVYSLETGEHEILLEDARFPRYVAPGYLLYAKRFDLMVDTFDPQRLELGGNPVMLDERTYVSTWSGKADFALAQDGTFVYGPPFQTPSGRTLVWVDRSTGAETPTTFGAGAYGHIALSPSGSKVALEIMGEGTELWIGDTRTGTKIRFEAESGFNPIWSPDGEQIYWARNSATMLNRRAADGSSPAEELEAWGLAKTLTPDGKQIVVARLSETTGWDLWLTTPDGEAAPFIDEPGMQLDCAFSKDGKWVAYRSIDGGRVDIFVSPYPNVRDARLRVPGTGNRLRPIWSQDGSELFFIQDSFKLMAATVTTTPNLSIGDPELIYADLDTSLANGYEYAPMPDGKRFLVIKQDPAFLNKRPEMHVVVNWIEVLKAKLKP